MALGQLGADPLPGETMAHEDDTTVVIAGDEPPAVGRSAQGELDDLRCFVELRQATKYFAWGWWQMIASVVCSGWSWKPSETSTPMREASRSSATLALSIRSGHAG